MSQEMKQTSFLILVLFLVICMVFVYWIKPKIDLQNEKIDQVSELKQTNMDLNWRVKQIQQNGLAERFYIAATRRAVPESQKFESLLNDARSLELVSGIPFPNYNWKEDPTPINLNIKTKFGNGSVQVVPIYLSNSFTAPFDKLETLLQEIQDMPRIMQVKELSITSNRSAPVSINDNSKQLSVSMTIQAFYAPALATVVAKEQTEEYKPPRVKNQPFE